MALPLQSWFFIAIGAPGGDSDGNKETLTHQGIPARLTNGGEVVPDKI
jgi:hypothetical protein